MRSPEPKDIQWRIDDYLPGPMSKRLHGTLTITANCEYASQRNTDECMKLAMEDLVKAIWHGMYGRVQGELHGIISEIMRTDPDDWQSRERIRSKIENLIDSMNPRKG